MNSEPTRTKVPPTVDPITKSDHDSTQPPENRPAASTEQQSSSQRYILREEIARGGMGTVHAAWDTMLQREVAVKLLQDQYTPSSTVGRRFFEEAQITGQLQHPGIPPIYDLGKLADGRPFLAMKLIKGSTLAELISQKAAINRLAVFEAICQAVGYAHAHGVIHRDLKPANVMVGSFGEVQVMDWGVAKLRSNEASREVDPHGSSAEETAPGTAIISSRERDDATRAGSILGTPAFMPPEQAIGAVDQIDQRSDVFGLGAILCTLLTGKPPYVGGDAESTRQLAARGKLDDAVARLISCEAEPELIALCQRCLSVEKADRPTDAGAVAKEVAELRIAAEERARQAELERTRAEVTMTEDRKRRRLWNMAAGVVAAVLLAGIVGTSIGLWRANQFAEAERLAKQDAEAKKTEAQQAQARAEAGEKLADERLLQVESEKKRADEEKQIAQAVKDFLQNKLLAQADTTAQADQLLRSGGLATDAKLNPTIRELLDRAAKELAADTIEANFPNQPLVQAEILWTVGDAYRGVGEAVMAIEFLSRSVELYKANLGPDHPGTLTCMNNLALGHLDAGQLDKAMPLLEETLKLRKAKLGPDHPGTLTSMNNLALVHLDAGQFDKALPLLEETLKLRKAKLGYDHPDTLKSMGNLAGGYQALGQLNKALPLFEETLKLRKAKLGYDHPDTLTSMNNLADGYRTAEQLDKALPLFEETLKLTKTKLGPDHPDTLISMNNLADGYRTAEQLDKALPLFEKTLKLTTATLGPDHPHTLTSMNNLAACYWSLKRLDKSVPLFEELLPHQEKKLGRGHPDTLLTVANLGVNYMDAGRVAEALPLLEEAYPVSKKFPTLYFVGLQLLEAYIKAGKITESAKLIDELLADARTNLHNSGGPQLAGKLAQFGLKLLELQRYAEAEELLRQALTIRQKIQPNAWATFHTQSLLGEALLGQMKFDEAEPLLLEGYKGLKAREKTIPPQSATRIPEAIDRLARYYLDTYQPEEAAKWQAERAKYPPETAPRPRLLLTP